ncbi:MAG: hypothetical protein KF773_30780 [Deltaproteobacteria bacterium]|nr:hypothetical protein [Deltaproteobacteria bacterium]
MRIAVALTLLSAACGRFGFDRAAVSDDEAGDAPPPTIDTGPAATLACNTPSRFPIGAANLSKLTATAVGNGFAVFGVDTAGRLAGWSYQFDATGALVAVAQDVTIDGDIADNLGAAAIGDDIVLAAITGRISPTGTRLYPLDAALAPRGPKQSYAEFAGTVPLAAHGGKLAFLASQGSLQVEARRVSTLGVMVGAPTVVAPAALRAGNVAIAPRGTGWIATWVGAVASPNSVDTALLDESLAVVAGPVGGNATMFDPIQPRAAWAKGSGTYLFTWYAKNAVDDDELFVQLADANLDAIGTTVLAASFSYAPSVASDGTDFWLVWNNYNLARLETMRVSAAGVLSAAAPVTTSGGVPGQWTMVERLGQAVLVWAEVGGSGPDLWISALCP